MMRVIRLYSTPWAPEYAATCLSLAFMAAIVALLAVYNNQSLAAWLLPSVISPNAVIAALNTLSRLSTSFVLSSAIGQWKWISISRKQRSLKSFVYIDESSKGSFGGLKIVWNTRGRTWVCIGAILMTLNLASDPFIQQIISLQPAVETRDDHNVTVNRAFAYAPGPLSPSSSMRGALQQALATKSSNDLPSPPFSCQSGNCSYPAFETLGFCSQCINLTNLLTTSSGTSGSAGYTTFKYGNMSLTNGDHGGDTPGGGDKSVMNLTSTGRDRSWGHTDDFGTFIHADHLNITNYTDPLTPEFIFGMTMINLTNVDSLKTWPDSANVVATECMLKWCVLQTGTDDTNTTVTNGTLQQSLVPRDDVSISKGSMEDGGINGGDWWISFNSPGRTSPYNVSSFASLYISDFLIQDLLGLLSPNGISDPNSTTDSSGGQDVKFYTSVVGIDDGNQINALPNPAVQAIYTNGNFTQTFEILARAMTSELFRSDNTTVVTGSQDISTTKLVVLWVWITLPLGVIILSALFLILTVVASARVNAPIWKSGLLPVLLHGFDSADARRHAQGQLEKESEMRDYADGIDIRLRHTDEDGIRIAREEPDNTITTRRDRRGYVEVADDRQENGESSVTELRQLPNKPGLEYPSASSGFPGE